MNESSKRILRKVLLFLLILLFLLTSVFSLSAIGLLQGNARVINYTGIVRGATQRLVKQEMNHQPNEVLIQYLDDVLTELSNGKGEYGLSVLPDPSYQDLILEMKRYWAEIKAEIRQVRNGSDTQVLFQMSEEYFELADRAVSSAERYSEQSVKAAAVRQIILSISFTIFVVLFWLYDRRQRKIEIALRVAEDKNRAKSNFLSRMSHEIRTPMNGIIGMTTIARMSVDDRDKLMDCLDKIDLSSGYLMALLNDILDMSRIESGRLELYNDPFDLIAMMDRFRAMFQLKAEEVGVAFETEIKGLVDRTVIGDELRISQVVVNIVSNAMKFTPKGGTVTLLLRQTEATEENVSLEFTITDTGAGMSEEFLERIFDPFEQEHGTSSHQYGGTGLGLAISYHFVKAMDGEIIVKSKLNEGSKFLVRLTLARPEQGETGAEEPASETLSVSQDQSVNCLDGITILLAEDNEINAEIVKVILESYGAVVDQAWNGREAVECFKCSTLGSYRLILMDIQMPEMDGVEACRQIRKLNRADSKQVPIFGLSANAFRKDIDEALESGMNGYLSKPIDMGNLIKTIRPFLQQ